MKSERRCTAGRTTPMQATSLRSAPDRQRFGESMSSPSENETWVIEEGGRVIEKEAARGRDSLNPWEKLVHCLWVADYGMRNAGDLDTAGDLYADFQSEACKIASELSLAVTRET